MSGSFLDLIIIYLFICIYMCLINYFFVYLFKFKQGHFSSYIHAYLKSLKEQKIYSR